MKTDDTNLIFSVDSKSGSTRMLFVKIMFLAVRLYVFGASKAASAFIIIDLSILVNDSNPIQTYRALAKPATPC